MVHATILAKMHPQPVRPGGIMNEVSEALSNLPASGSHTFNANAADNLPCIPQQ
jgi:hypothetical protein